MHLYRASRFTMSHSYCIGPDFRPTIPERVQRFISTASILPLLLACSFISLGLHTVSAQGAETEGAPGEARFLYGIGAGLLFSSHSGGIETRDASYPCCTFSGGDGTGFAAGVRLVLPVAGHVEFAPTASYEGIAGTFTNTDQSYPVLNRNQQVEYVTMENVLDVSISSISVAALFRYSILPLGVYVTAGPSIHSLVSKRYSQVETITGATDVEYVDGRSSRTLFDRDIDNMRSLGFGGCVGAGVHFALSQHVSMEMEAVYTVPFTKLRESGDWKASGIGLNLYVLLGSE